MTTLTPEQLPSTNSQFIAYGSPERVADPFGGDDAISVRPQVFVRYYRGIKIKELAAPNDDTVNVVFDPESVGLQKAFGAYMNADDRVAAYIKEQFEAGKPIDVGVEYQRRKKTKKEKAPISPLTPIHALRGANSTSGTGDSDYMMGRSGNNIHSKIALVNGRRTTVIQSDPREWGVLTSNTQGDLPPAGWKALADPEDWTRIGVIAPRDGAVPSSATATPQQGAAQGLDMNTLSKIIGNEVRKGLKDYGEYLMRQDDATYGTSTSQTANSSVEGRPWNLWINKNQLNLGSYLVSGEGHALRWAFTYLGTLGDDVLDTDTELRWEAARELADASQKIADRVQSTAYNGEVRADRTSLSFKESVMWVRFHIETRYSFSGDDGFDYDTWFDNVGRAATESLREAESRAFEFISERYPKAQSATEGQGDAAEKATGEDPTPVVAAYVQMLAQQWMDRDGVLNLAREAKAKNLLDVEVWANPNDGKFSVDPFDGGKEITIGHLTKRQYGLLSQAADTTESVEPPHEEEATPTEDDGTPKAEEPSEPQAATPASQAPARSAQHIAAALAKATTEGEIGANYEDAKELNYLTAEVTVQRGVGHFGIAPVRPNTEGAETMTLGAVFDALRAAIDEGQQAPAQTQTPPSEAPQENQTPAPQEDPDEAAPAATQEPAESAESAEPAAPAPEPTEEAQETTPSVATSTAEESAAQDIAQRGLDADPAEIEALFKEAREKGVESAQVDIRNRRGTLGGFLTSRLKHAQRPGR